MFYLIPLITLVNNDAKRDFYYIPAQTAIMAVVLCLACTFLLYALVYIIDMKLIILCYVPAILLMLWGHRMKKAKEVRS